MKPVEGFARIGNKGQALSSGVVKFHSHEMSPSQTDKKCLIFCPQEHSTWYNAGDATESSSGPTVPALSTLRFRTTRFILFFLFVDYTRYAEGDLRAICRGLYGEKYGIGQADRKPTAIKYHLTDLRIAAKGRTFQQLQDDHLLSAGTETTAETPETQPSRPLSALLDHHKKPTDEKRPPDHR
ncbi:hypothetical protein BDV28DRAFT_147707 [Aspergillus coremiiformis]|uniref:Uncharacterized protein n=1 Tax=Aspergillus coremiiformis TaxID=138285 RepID=A0A5N6Z7Y4_9EURO|nr:hypothetical protein BDV28DRAFT_147707 [Aspergillus coremiiformis]